MTNYHIMYPMKQKDLCDYNPVCIVSSNLMFDEIIMCIISNNEFPHPTEEKYCLFTHIDNNIIYVYRGYFYLRKVT